VRAVSDVRVLTWNVFHCRDAGPPGPTRDSTWRRRPVEADGYVHLNRTLVAAVAGVIRRARPDVCMLQEVPPLAVPELARRAGMACAWSVLTGPVVGPVWLRGRLARMNPDLWRTHGGNANVILIGPRVRPLRGSAGAVRLNPWGTVLREWRAGRLAPGATPPWLREARRALGARVVLPGGIPAAVVCVHLHNARGTRESEVEADALARALRRVDGPLLLGGDLNVPPGHPALDALTDLGLTDGGTDPRVGIDRILVRGLRIVSPPRRWDPSERDVRVRGRAGHRLVRLSDHDPVEAVVGPEG
jgi:endonuclease/exonuclease/phosphatase family metal-dependent hydrolase